MNSFRRFIACLDFTSVVWSRGFSTYFHVRVNKFRFARSKSIYYDIFSHPLSPKSKMAAPVQVAKAHAQVKPPNVLVLQPHRDSTSQEFSRIRDALESCLAPERYVVYPLGLEEIQQSSPWQDNCRLLLVPPPPSAATQSRANGGDPGADQTVSRLCEKILQEIATYVSKGGVLLSMHAEVNRMLGLDSVSEVESEYLQHGVCNVETTSNKGSDNSADRPALDKFNALHISVFSPSLSPSKEKQSHDRVNGIEQDLEAGVISKEDLAVLALIETDAALEWLDANTNQSNNVESEQGSSAPKRPHDSGEAVTPVSAESDSTACVRRVELERGGKAILSNVDLFPLVGQDLGVKVLVWLKRDVEKRRKFLSSLLDSLGLECSEENLPELTHTYLVCSREVSMQA